MSDFVNWYPGHHVARFVVIVAAAVAVVSVVALIVSWRLKRYPAVRHWVLLSALLCGLASPVFAAAFLRSEISLVTLPLLAALEMESAAGMAP